ncbi:MAG TPA: SGNH/GDSL hydrolase family protein [Oligoflexus sp.]|uniref:SGNH/GDSL hydrolase family protein n=1 Tax=Oligoflexus sp. TaxID=1971216 RepID=UPI002D284EA9|nr:SGNH/GDSL hydrolase family protein [Oligoflexus sp.]HYX37577.1 SGNH/GDSL hydrolase family protein [Oligoflexus sp.]
MLRYLACLVMFLGACQTNPAAPSQDKASAANEDKGPNVNDLVKPNQEKWLTGQVQNPAKAKITKLLVFGDSLSDPGHLNKLTQNTYVPARVFYKSRFSNGPIWADYVSAGLNWTLDNYAVGLAETRKNGSSGEADIPSLLQQISDSKSELKKLDFASTLVVIWIGPQNYFKNAVKAQDANQNPVTEALEKQVKDTVSDIQDGIENLQDIGFRQFVIGTMPELGGLNRNPKDPPKASDATLYAVTAAHNTALRAMLKTLPKELPEVNVTLFQANEINQKTVENPKNYGFNRLDAPCYVGNLQGRFDGPKAFCADPAGFKYWEYVHPNSKMHCVYATQMLSDLTTAGKIGGYEPAKALARCMEL